MLCRILDAASNNLTPYQVIITDCTEKCHFFLHFSQTGRGGAPRREKCVQFCNTKCLPAEISVAICQKGQIAPMMWEGDFHRLRAEGIKGRAAHWSQKKGALAYASAPSTAILLACISIKSPEVHQNSALPTVRGCSSTSRMLLTPVRYITIRSKPRPKPACLQEP